MIIKPHLALDGYKTGHQYQYPDNTQVVYSNFTARSATHAKMPKSFDNKTVFVGLQGFIKDFLIDSWNTGFFRRPKSEVIAEYKRRMDTYLGPDAIEIEHMEALHDLGYLPIAIVALPEGSRVDIKVPYFIIWNTNPDFFWLTNALETALSTGLWKAITVATIAYEYRRILNKYVELTGSDKAFADWQLHDFSMRGLSGIEDAHVVGAAHLMAAGYGTDTLPGIDYLEAYYNADAEKELIGGSVPATEHSVMCMGGKESEIETFRRLINDVYPTGIVSIVSDSWDYWRVLTEYAVTLKDEILARKPNALGQAKVVFRPDSGDPVKIIAGLRVFDSNYDYYDRAYLAEYDCVKCDDRYWEFTVECDYDAYGLAQGHWISLGKEIPAHIVKGSVEMLWDTFGGTTTDKGFKTLHERVGLIYGDSITMERCEEILKRLADKGFSAGNIVFGIGSFTYQYITRDTFGMAMKATWGMVDDVGRDLEKDPATGDGIKKSAKGLLRVEKEDDKFVLYDQQPAYAGQGVMETVFFNGRLAGETSLSEIRKKLKQ